MGTQTQNTTTLENILDLYILDRTPSKATIESFERFIRIFKNDTNITHIGDIDKHQLNLWKRDLLNRVRQISCNTYLRHIKTLVLFAFDEGIIDANPFFKFRMAKVPEKPFKSIENSDVSKALSFLDNNPLPPAWFWRIVIHALYYTGVRRRQLVGLNWDDINLNEQIIKLRSEISKTGKEWELPIHEKLLPHLIYLKEKSQNRYHCCNKSLLTKQVFNVTLFNDRYKGNRMTEDQLSGFFRNLSDKSNIAISSHRFRHRLATDLSNNSTNVKNVQEILGHRDVKTTLEYVSSNFEQMRESMSAITPI